MMHNGQSADIEVYFAQGIKHMYLLLDVCKKINVVHREFPHVDLSSTPSISNITISDRVEKLPLDQLIRLLKKTFQNRKHGWGKNFHRQLLILLIHCH